MKQKKFKHKEEEVKSSPEIAKENLTGNIINDFTKNLDHQETNQINYKEIDNIKEPRYYYDNKLLKSTFFNTKLPFCRNQYAKMLNLQQIKGIGPRYSEHLIEEGIYCEDDLKEMSDVSKNRISSKIPEGTIVKIIQRLNAKEKKIYSSSSILKRTNSVKHNSHQLQFTHVFYQYLKNQSVSRNKFNQIPDVMMKLMKKRVNSISKLDLLFKENYITSTWLKNHDLLNLLNDFNFITTNSINYLTKDQNSSLLYSVSKPKMFLKEKVIGRKLLLPKVKSTVEIPCLHYSNLKLSQQYVPIVEGGRFL